MAMAVASAALRVARLPGDLGPTVQCSGDLCRATARVLGQELAWLMSSSHRLIVLDISQCSTLDLAETLALIDAFKRRRRTGQRLVILAGNGLLGRVLGARRSDWLVPVFPSEHTARRALVDQSFHTPVTPIRGTKD